jgi:hypothetical protein
MRRERMKAKYYVWLLLRDRLFRPFRARGPILRPTRGDALRCATRLLLATIFRPSALYCHFLSDRLVGLKCFYPTNSMGPLVKLVK